VRIYWFFSDYVTTKCKLLTRKELWRELPDYTLTTLTTNFECENRGAALGTPGKSVLLGNRSATGYFRFRLFSKLHHCLKPLVFCGLPTISELPEVVVISGDTAPTAILLRSTGIIPRQARRMKTQCCLIPCAFANARISFASASVQVKPNRAVCLTSSFFSRAMAVKWTIGCVSVFLAYYTNNKRLAYPSY